jgi:DNA-binding CsgD family transcriptional regulator
MAHESALPLSPRQLDCLRLAALGRTSLGIADALGISPRTVDEYIADACRRLGVRNRTQAVAKVAALGLLTEGTP